MSLDSKKFLCGKVQCNLSPAFRYVSLLLMVSICILFSSINSAHTQDFPLPNCKNIRIADTGRQDLVVFNATLSLFAKMLKFQPQTVFISPQRLLSRLKERRVDVFLGHWGNAQAEDISDLIKKKQLRIMNKPLLKDAYYGLATPSYMSEKGLSSISDIPQFAKELNYQITSIKENNNGNKTLEYLISSNKEFDKFKLILIATKEYSNTIATMTESQTPFVIMSWEPNFNNSLFNMIFLDQTKISSHLSKEKNFQIFPSDSMYAITHGLLDQQCPEINLLISQLSFSKEMTQSIMKLFVVDKIPLETAIISWLKNNARFVADTLVNVSDINGKNGFKSVMNFIHHR